jgi:hypothetical protein
MPVEAHVIAMLEGERAPSAADLVQLAFLASLRHVPSFPDILAELVVPYLVPGVLQDVPQ